MKRAVLRLLSNEGVKAGLVALYSLFSKLWNEINYAGRRMFFETNRVDLRKTYEGVL